LIKIWNVQWVNYIIYMLTCRSRTIIIRPHRSWVLYLRSRGLLLQTE